MTLKLWYYFQFQQEGLTRGAFQGWRVILLADPKREANFKRLLTAGGASVINVKYVIISLPASVCLYLWAFSYLSDSLFHWKRYLLSFLINQGFYVRWPTRPSRTGYWGKKGTNKPNTLNHWSDGSRKWTVNVLTLC